MLLRGIISVARECRRCLPLLAALPSNSGHLPILYRDARYSPVSYRFMASEPALPEPANYALTEENTDTSDATSTEESKDGYQSRSSSSAENSGSVEEVHQTATTTHKGKKKTRTKKPIDDFYWISLLQMPPDVLTKEIEFSLGQLNIKPQIIRRGMFRNTMKMTRIAYCGFLTSQEARNAVEVIRARKLWFGVVDVTPQLLLQGKPEFVLPKASQYSFVVRNVPLTQTVASVVSLYDFLSRYHFSPLLPSVGDSDYVVRNDKREEILSKDEQATTYVILTFRSETERSFLAITKPKVSFHRKTLSLDIVD